MNSFYEHHKDSIRWHYRCFDRILLNGLIQPFQQPERVVGFFNTYRQLYPVSWSTLRGIAEQFQTWLKAWAGKYHNHFVGLGSVEVGINEVIAAALRGFNNWDVPLKAREPAPS